MPLQIRSDPRFYTYLMWAKGCAAVYRFIRVSSCLRKVRACSFQPLWGPYTNTNEARFESERVQMPIEPDPCKANLGRIPKPTAAGLQLTASCHAA